MARTIVANLHADIDKTARSFSDQLLSRVRQLNHANGPLRTMHTALSTVPVLTPSPAHMHGVAPELVYVAGDLHEQIVLELPAAN